MDVTVKVLTCGFTLFSVVVLKLSAPDIAYYFYSDF